MRRSAMDHTDKQIVAMLGRLIDQGLKQGLGWPAHQILHVYPGWQCVWMSPVGAWCVGQTPEARQTERPSLRQIQLTKRRASLAKALTPDEQAEWFIKLTIMCKEARV